MSKLSVRDGDKIKLKEEMKCECSSCQDDAGKTITVNRVKEHNDKILLVFEDKRGIERSFHYCDIEKVIRSSTLDEKLFEI